MRARITDTIGALIWTLMLGHPDARLTERRRMWLKGIPRDLQSRMREERNEG